MWRGETMRALKGSIGATDRLYGFAYRMVNSQSVAEDVTHEAFLVLIERPTQYEPSRGSMLTFLCAVARNHIMRHFRHANLIESTLDEDVFYHAQHENCFPGDPLVSLLDEELREEVDRAIEALPVLLREAIVLREFQELSYEEISEVADVTVDVVKVRLHRARQALGRALGSYIQHERRLLS